MLKKNVTSAFVTAMRLPKPSANKVWYKKTYRSSKSDLVIYYQCSYCYSFDVAFMVKRWKNGAFLFKKN